MPGSYFMLIGVNFPPNVELSLLANDLPLPPVTSSSSGRFTVIILTSEQTHPGIYEFTVSQMEHVTASISVTSEGEYRDPAGLSGFWLPSVAIYLPAIQK